MGGKIKIVVVTGPTASGKTALAADLAARFGGEIISADSRQVYRGMDIGSGKDLSEYVRSGRAVPFHLIDIADPLTEEYNLFRFRLDSDRAVRDIHARGRLPVVAGGSALYIWSLLKGLTLPGGPPDAEFRAAADGKDSAELLERFQSESPEAASRFAEPENRLRLVRAGERARKPESNLNVRDDDKEYLTLGVYRERREIHARIERRLDERLKSGLIKEVKSLHERGLSWDKLDFFGLEYRFIALYLRGLLSLGETRDRLLFKIRQFAKSQDVWFRKMERSGAVIHWLGDGDRLEAASDLVKKFIAGQPLPSPKIKIAEIYYGARQ